MKHCRKVPKQNKELTRKELRKRINQLENENRILNRDSSEYHDLKRRIKALDSHQLVNLEPLPDDGREFIEFIERKVVQELAEFLYEQKLIKFETRVDMYSAGEPVDIIEARINVIAPEVSILK